MALTALEAKEPGELTAADVDAFLAAAPVETETLEFKRDADNWAIRRAVGGLANTYGGTFLLGIAERGGVAAEILPIADCAALARRIEQNLAASLSPPLPGLTVRAIATHDEAGIIVIRVPASSRRPHSVSKEGRGDALHVFVRRGAETRPADIREVQDMTLAAASQAQRVQARINEMQQRLLTDRERETIVRHRPAFQIHVSAAPASKVALMRGDLSPAMRPAEVDCDGPYGRIVYRDLDGEWRPIFRGIAVTTSRKHYACRAALYSDGALEIVFWARGLDAGSYNAEEEVSLYLGWWHGLTIARALWCEKVRQAVGEPALEFALGDLTVCDYPFVSLNSGDRYAGPLGYMPVEVHRPGLDQLLDEEDVQRLLNQATVDFYNLAGQSAPGGLANFNLTPVRQAWGLIGG
jgi:hypothetical protein